MTLERAIAYAIDREGIGIITEARFLNYLTDLQAFTTPALKRIVSAMIEDKYFDKLQSCLNDENHELQFNEVKTRLVRDEGFQENLVEYVLNCLLYAVCKTGNAPQMPSVPVEKKASPKPNPVEEADKTLKVIQTNSNYLVEYNGKSYELNKGQFDAIQRKQNMPADRLMLWLEAYVEQNS